MSVLQKRTKQKKFQNEAHDAIAGLMAAASVIRNRLNYICNKKDISIVQYNILRILKGSHPGGYPRYEISSRMIEHSPDITRLIDRLVKNGLVERSKSLKDMRHSIAKITDKGIAVLLDLNKQIENFQRDFQKKISKEQCRLLSAICDEILLVN